MNKIIVGDLLTISDKKYIVLDKINYLSKEYIFVNEMTNDEKNTDKYLVMKVVGECVTILEEKSLINNLLPFFSNNIQKMVNRVFE